MFNNTRQGENYLHFVLSALFVAAVAAAAWYMNEVRGGYLVSVSPFDAVIIALATFRITRLVVYDKVMSWLRIVDITRYQWFIAMLASLAVIFAYFVFNWAWFVIFLLAMAGTGSILQMIVSRIAAHGPGDNA